MLHYGNLQVEARPRHVRFTPNIGHRPVRVTRPPSARSRHPDYGNSAVDQIILDAVFPVILKNGLGLHRG